MTDEGHAALAQALNDYEARLQFSRGSFDERMDAMRAAIRAYLDALPWQFVPKDATKDMAEAGARVFYGDDKPYDHEKGNAVSAYEAMLEAAPPALGLEDTP